jgi:glucose/arabinose dehydrogenase
VKDLASLAIASLLAQRPSPTHLGPEPPPANPTPVSIRAERVAAGLQRPIFVTAPQGDAERVFVVEKPGIIRIIRNGTLLPTQFLNLEPQVQGGYTLTDEHGLTGLAFHPQYAQNGHFYIAYSAVSGATVVARYTVSGDPNVADPASGVTLLTQSQSTPIHNGACLQFGPDGYLYISMGDGGPALDPSCNAQNGLSLFGKLLRLDVDGGSPYAIPPDNPFVGNPSFRPEIWSYGLRNPWRFSFDRETGDLYIGDVGQEVLEEIDFQPAGSVGGENYGWNAMEGSSCHNEANCTNPPFCNDPGLVLPIHEYSHADPGAPCSVIGGVVYRGCAIPNLRGSYFYADFCSRQIVSFRYDGGTTSELVDRTAELTPPDQSIDFIASFGEDALGELYICDHGGELYKIVPADEPPPPTSYCSGKTSSTGCVPFLSTSGAASVSAGRFNLIGNDFIEGQIGYYIYGPEKANLNFHGGKLCVKIPFRRIATRIQSKDGVSCMACDGACRTFKRDFNELIRSGIDPALTCGAVVRVQMRQRDPLDPRGYGDSLSDAVTFTIGP